MSPTLDASRIRVVVFDVFGTLVDWRTSIAHAMNDVLPARDVDRARSFRLADEWRGCYQPSMEAVRSGARAYVSLDVLHRESLDTVLATMALDDVGATVRAELTMAWHRLQAWPDVNDGLRRLRSHHLLAPCSNGNIALMADLARHNGWHWDAIAGADLARNFKPVPSVYLAACAAFNAPPDEVLMVAAHGSDLQAAAQAGLRTAFIARPDEHGPGLGELEAGVPVDMTATDLRDLARQLGC